MILKPRPLVGLHRRFGAAGLAVLSLAVVACGGGSSSSPDSGPAFTAQPVSVTVRSTQTATFSATAKGKPEPTYLWQKNGVDIPGAISATLTISTTSPSDAGVYQVVVKNSVGTATSASATLTVQTTLLFNAPAGLVVDAAGNTYVANSGDHTIEKILPNGTVSIVAGSKGQSGYLDDTGTNARFSWPTSLAMDGAGTLYVADGNNTIRAISPAGVVTTLAGSAGLSGSTDGSGGAARFGDLLQGLTWDGAGHLIVADTYNHTIRQITTAGDVTTLAGQAGQPGSTNGAVATAKFNNPSGLVVNATGTLYVADYGNAVIRAITAGVVSTYAGTVGSAGSVDGAGTSATFNRPMGLVVDSGGRLFVADALNGTIRKVDVNGTVSTFAGSNGLLSNLDGTGTAARFNRPVSLVLLPGDALRVGDSANGQIRNITSAGVVTTLVYTGP